MPHMAPPWSTSAALFIGQNIPTIFNLQIFVLSVPKFSQTARKNRSNLPISKTNVRKVKTRTFTNNTAGEGRAFGKVYYPYTKNWKLLHRKPL